MDCLYLINGNECLLVNIIIKIKEQFTDAIAGTQIAECKYSLPFWIYCKIGANTYTSHLLELHFEMIDKGLYNYITHESGIYDKNNGKEWDKIIELCNKSILHLTNNN